MKKILSIALALCLVLSFSVTAFATESTTWATGGTATGVTAWDGNSSVSQDITVPADFDATNFAAANVTPNYFVVLTWEVSSTLKYTIQTSDFSWHIYDDDSIDSKNASFDGTANKAGYEGTGDWSGSATVSVNVDNWSNRPIAAGFAYADSTASVSGVETAINTSASGIQTIKQNGTDVTSISLASAADGVAVYAAADARNHVATTYPVVLTINAEAGRPEGGKSLMTGVISADDAVIGTLTVTISDNTPVSTPEP